MSEENKPIEETSAAQQGEGAPQDSAPQDKKPQDGAPAGESSSQ